MKLNMDYGLNYVFGENEQYSFIKIFGVTKTSSNAHEIPDNWILRYFWTDESGNIHLKKGKGRKICIEMNQHRKFEDGDKYAVLCEIANELRDVDIESINEVSAGIEDIVQKEIQKSENQFKNRFIANIEHVKEWNWSGEKVLGKLIELDYQTMSGLNEEHEGNASQWAPLWMKHPETWRLLIESPDKIIGYWHFAALDNKDFRLAKSGRLFDKDISLDNAVYMKSPRKYNGYLISFVLANYARGNGNLRLLLSSFYNHLSDLAEKRIYIKELCANAFTDNGVSLCKALGMEYICNHSDKGKIFSRNFLPFSVNGKLEGHYKRFIDAYKNAK